MQSAQSHREIDQLLERTTQGDDSARDRLLESCRPRLAQMLAMRMDRRLLGRLDPSDIVQEALVDAAQKFEDYVKTRPMPFYPWLRRLACERLIAAHRHHVGTQKRSVLREEAGGVGLPDESAVLLAERLADSGTSPSENVMREERRQAVRHALTQLRPNDQEILVLVYLEELTFEEIAAVLGLKKEAVEQRHLRALKRIRPLLE